MIFFRKPEDERAPTGKELADLRVAIQKAQLPDYVASAARKELERLEKTDPAVAEYSIGLNYLDYLISLPWNQFTEDNLDLKRAERILESKHYGLQHVKERVLEYLAVRTLCSIQTSRVLVVDDEEIARHNLEYILRKEGHQVATAANGVEALDQVKSHDFDLVLTDLKMDRMDGLQLLESVKRLSPHTEIIMVTGYATVTTAVDALRKGAAHYLSKPIKLDELRETVREIIDRKRHMQMARGPILCFAGPPGTGKTSMGQAIAEALERKFVRMSLAGLRDEAELRGHRRTYVGAMPGRIINEIKRLEVKNPVFMLDEIDKIGQDFRGDPASILLEILDPEQNHHFIDHYVDLPFDLSGVMFITTANVVGNLPLPLLDRLEVINFPGYTEGEKKKIAKNYLIPRQLRDSGLTQLSLEFTDEAIIKIIRDYTREAGLRNLEREIAMICRKLARICLRDKAVSCPTMVDEVLVERFLGPRKFSYGVAESERRLGVTTGLVWTELGGEIISVEATRMRGNKQLILTGSLGSVLQESAQTAMSYIRSHAEQFQIPPDFFTTSDIHIHIPSGAIPKEGPSSGITIALALLSLLTGRPARQDVALSGELTLNGRLLPVSGIREKIMAAQRAGIKTVIFPKQNEVDINNLEEEVKKGLEIVLAEEIPPIIDLVLLPA
ncbi:MAG: endopeptidase La [Deltaproteobacteria bacterium]|nr:endopeptidase La [Deltaproteobacteria bacterium]MBW1952574.1 endopeptidase La [Deltaproteobacteria bacterium]MBW1986141.1 endopeptidase La [Deltaproteobacteria bacterium]MBW2134173.1 endopeptidase La [Deltaproteobacteria bacterium]